MIAAVLGAALVGATLLSSLANEAKAQTEPAIAANGVLLPPMDFDPASARNQELTGSTIVPVTSTAPVSATGESPAAAAPDAATDAPEGAAATPENGNSMTTSLGGLDVAVSSVGGSYEVDGPRKRSDRRN
jgi:hypothetical protein